MIIIEDYYNIPTVKEIKCREYFTMNIIINNSFLKEKDKLKKTKPMKPIKNWWNKEYIYDKYIAESLEWWKKDYIIDKYNLSK